MAALLGAASSNGVGQCAETSGHAGLTNWQERNDNVVVEMWQSVGKGAQHNLLKRQVYEFNRSHPDIYVNLRLIPENRYKNLTYETAMMGTLPCLLNFDGPYLYYYVWGGFLAPIDKYVTDDYLKDFIPSVVSQGTYEGRLYSLGVFDSGLAIWGNRSYLKKAGVRIPRNLKTAWSGSEFREALSKLQSLEEVEYAIDLKTNYGRGEWYVYAFLPLLESFGGGVTDRGYTRSTGILNGPSSVEALTFLQSLFDKGYANPSPSGDGDFYLKRKTALSLSGHWMWAKHQNGLREDLVLIPMPQFGGKAVTGMGSWNWGISSQCDHPDAAWKLLEFLLEPEQIARHTTINGGVPARYSVVEASPLYREGGPLRVFFEQLEEGVGSSRPKTAAYPKISELFSFAVDAIIRGSDVEAELDKAVSGIDPYLELVSSSH